MVVDVAAVEDLDQHLAVLRAEEPEHAKVILAERNHAARAGVTGIVAPFDLDLEEAVETHRLPVRLALAATVVIVVVPDDAGIGAF